MPLYSVTYFAVIEVQADSEAEAVHRAEAKLDRAISGHYVGDYIITSGMSPHVELSIADGDEMPELWDEPDLDAPHILPEDLAV